MPEVTPEIADLGLEDPGSSVDLLNRPDTPSEGFSRSLDDLLYASEDRALEAERRFEQGQGDKGQVQSQWDSPDNPYRQKYQDLESRVNENRPTVGQQLERTRAQHQQWAAEAYEMATRQGMDPQVAEQIIATKLAELNTGAELAATRAATLPLVRRDMANQVAAEYSEKKAGVVVNADELDGYTSLEAMRARADALATERRNKMRDTRKANGTDRAEGAAPATGISRIPDNISPAMRIRIGLERGHL